jgi:hypothetical protein
MRGAQPPLYLHAFMVWCLVQGQAYLCLYFTLLSGIVLCYYINEN